MDWLKLLMITRSKASGLQEGCVALSKFRMGKLVVTMKYFFTFIPAVLLTLISADFSGVYVEDEQQYRTYLEHAREGGVELGFPFPFVTQNPSKLSPPFPYKFGLEMERITNLNVLPFFVNVGIYFMIILFMHLFFNRIIRKVRRIG